MEQIHTSERVAFTKTEHELKGKIDELEDLIKSFEKNQSLLNETIVSLNRSV